LAGSQGGASVFALSVGLAFIPAYLLRCIHNAGKDARFDEIKPSFVAVLLTRTSGAPILEKRADKK
jgi:hypothetical protein